ncbi:hypothetical protein [Nitrincola alkalilacustris]|uniref:hypothetical protein n=1 Tax=Nitrincola alkalilacustris TaxID=1571224 RepID=UPI00124E19D4|nr:hypothetical protein [Nitrincola alkalilacustris]
MRAPDISAFKSAVQHHLSNSRQSTGFLFAFFLMFALLAGQQLGLQHVKSAVHKSPATADFQQGLAPVLLQETFGLSRVLPGSIPGTPHPERDNHSSDPVQDLLDHLALSHQLSQSAQTTTRLLTLTHRPDRRDTPFLSTLTARAPPLFI